VCEAADQLDCDTSYRLDSYRIGGNVRIMSSGERVRFTSTLGIGAVRHVLKVEGQPERKGNDPYFLVELGAQFNFGHVLLEADVLLFIDGTQQIRDEEGPVFGEDSGLRMLGLGLRGGWGEWKPR